MGSARLAHVQSALNLSYFTVAWNGVVGIMALAAAVVSGSTALAASVATPCVLASERPAHPGNERDSAKPS